MTTEMFNVSPAATQSGSRIRKTVTRGLLVAAMTGGLAFGMAMPAFADGPTATTFTINEGAIGVSMSGTAALTDADAGASTITGQLGTVTVTDARGGEVSWNLSAISTKFTLADHVESDSPDVTYATGPVTLSGEVTAPATLAQSVLTTKVVLAGTAVSGNNTAFFNPTLIVSLPARALAGDYAGTVTTSIL